ncbi:FAS1-like dehydratase domain-containing protein [Piscinibacter sakaiensis]|uniref:COG3777 family protein n=1 Tax=Piscinibacter sakaiensis TaxID=1547922 RepID=A0A0K8P3Q1_PISS1|nr:MaoC family dehydratase N-terminal domain-containing protein [Piscinibacter sakaiensis]GAP37201.1 COG3777 family protein [Piscinibacter sakaiensis]
MDDRPDADLARLRDWIGRTETRGDEVGASAVAAMAAALDRDDPAPLPGSALPPLWHWMFFNPAEPQHRLGPDGHPLRGGFLPPVPLPRRMWAGGRLSFHHPLRVGDELTRRSHIADVAVKHGRSGPLVFVTVRHEITNAQGLALTEEHDIVYREAPAPGAPAVPPQAAPRDEACARRLLPDPVLLFRYSALTFNGHRIHYDRPYATGVEGYPGLVVHGPLIATLLLDLLRRERPDAVLRRFEFAARRPVFDQQPLELCGRPDGAGAWRLWARDHDGWLAMQARAELG